MPFRNPNPQRRHIVTDCAVRNAVFDRNAGNRLKTREEYAAKLDEYLDGNESAGRRFDVAGWSFTRLVDDSYRVYRRLYKSESEEHLSACFSRGVRDFRDGIEFDDCPYKGKGVDRQRSQWESGFRAAENKSAKDK